MRVSNIPRFLLLNKMHSCRRVLCSVQLSPDPSPERPWTRAWQMRMDKPTGYYHPSLPYQSLDLPSILPALPSVGCCVPLLQHKRDPQHRIYFLSCWKANEWWSKHEITKKTRNTQVYTKKPTKNKTLCPESASALYRPSDCRLSAKLVSTFADRGVSRSHRGGSPTVVLSAF
jgi:hypothetical protein